MQREGTEGEEKMHNVMLSINETDQLLCSMPLTVNAISIQGD